MLNDVHYIESFLQLFSVRKGRYNYIYKICSRMISVCACPFGSS